MMTLKYICVFDLLLLFAFGTIPAEGELQFYKSDTSLSAPDGERICTLASPPIIYNEGGMFVDVENSYTKDLLAGDQTYWIGYAQQFAIFLYRGCAIASDVSSNNYTKMIKDPGICYSSCQTDFIGIQENNCYCIKSLPAKDRLFSPYCTSQCTYPPGALCGGMQSVSVYQKRVSVVQTSAKPTVRGSCLVYQPGGKTFSWIECLTSTYPAVMCQNDDAVKVIHEYGHWDFAMKYCLRHNMFPINASFRPLPPENYGPQWTGEIRSYAVFNTKDAHYNRGEGLHGFIELNRTAGKYQLRFESPPGSLFALCVNTRESSKTTISRHASATRSTLPMNTVTSVESSKTTRYGHASTTGLLLPSNIVTSGELFKTTSSGHVCTTRSPLSSNTVTSVVLYIAIPVSLVVITGLVLVVLWRRGYIRVCRHTESDFDEKKSRTVTTANTKLESEPYSEGPQHDYFVLEPLSNFDSVNNAKKQDRTEALYDQTSRFTKAHCFSVTDNSSEYFKEDDYDTTTSISKAMSLAYDRLDTGDTYNHIGEMKNMSAKIDATYNHLEPKKSETMYDTASTVSKNIEVVDYNDAMYSKVLKKK